MNVYQNKDKKGNPYLLIQADNNWCSNETLYDLIRDFNLKYNKPIIVSMTLQKSTWNHDIIIIERKERDREMIERLTYKEFIEKTKTREKCPLCGHYYFDHIGTGREYLCVKNKCDHSWFYKQNIKKIKCTKCGLIKEAGAGNES